MNTPMEMDTNVGSAEEREAFADTVNARLETIGKVENNKLFETEVNLSINEIDSSIGLDKGDDSEELILLCAAICGFS